MKKIIPAAAVISAALISLYAFDWPQPDVQADSFFSYFGQNRGSTINKSLIFQDSSDIRVAAEGTVIGVITEHDGDQGWFNSTLGNAVIIAHKDNLLTVYGNLDAESLPADIKQLSTVEGGTPLGTSGDSGWRDNQSSLEFQVIDTKQRTAINPRVLMPRISKERELAVGSLSAVNKDGTEYDFRVTQTLQAGRYRIYEQVKPPASKNPVPYKTTLSINGTVVETISYDILRQEYNRICVSGTKSYPAEIVYPDEKKHLLGDINLTKGRNVISVILYDILGSTATVSYTINVQ